MRWVVVAGVWFVATAAWAGGNTAIMAERRQAMFSLNEQVLKGLGGLPDGSTVVMTVKIGPRTGSGGGQPGVDRDYRVERLVVLDRLPSEHRDAVLRVFQKGEVLYDVPAQNSPMMPPRQPPGGSNNGSQPK